jgi:hypothetical protein
MQQLGVNGTGLFGQRPGIAVGEHWHCATAMKFGSPRQADARGGTGDHDDPACKRMVHGQVRRGRVSMHRVLQTGGIVMLNAPWQS